MKYDKTSMIPGWRIYILLLLVILLLALPSGGGAEDGGPGPDKMQAPPEFNVDDEDVSRMVKRHFSDFGPVDFINEDRIVIGDLTYPLSPDASISGIDEDDFVGIVLNGAGRVVEVKPVQRPE